MALLNGKILVTCPRTGQEVNVKKVCSKPGQRCEHFKHISYRGLTPQISCTYNE